MSTEDYFPTSTNRQLRPQLTDRQLQLITSFLNDIRRNVADQDARNVDII